MSRIGAWTAAVLAALLVLASPVPAAATPEAGRPGPADAGPAPALPRFGWAWPLIPAPTVARPFDPPAVRWAPGHRGVDLVAAEGDAVRAPAPGRVTFAGVVVDRGVLTLEHAGGVRTSYEPVTATVKAGDLVVAGQVVAMVSGDRSHCTPSTCLHWGARRGEGYIDPVRLLRGAEPPVLLPLNRLIRPG